MVLRAGSDMESEEIVKKRTWARRMLTLNANRLNNLVELSESIGKVNTALQNLEIAYKNLSEVEEAAFVAGCECPESEIEVYMERYSNAKAKAVEFVEEETLLGSNPPSPMDVENDIPAVSNQYSVKDGNCSLGSGNTLMSTDGLGMPPLEVRNFAGSTEPQDVQIPHEFRVSNVIDVNPVCAPLEPQKLSNTVTLPTGENPKGTINVSPLSSNNCIDSAESNKAGNILLSSRLRPHDLDLVCTPLGSQRSNKLSGIIPNMKSNELSNLQAPLEYHDFKSDRSPHEMKLSNTPLEPFNSDNAEPLNPNNCYTPLNSDNTHQRFMFGAALPEISLPTFSGGYSEWVSFMDIFLSLIDNDPRLTDTMKLHYLKSSLTGEAAALLSAIPVTSKNYKLAWERLVARFDRQGTVVDHYISKMINFQDLGNRSHDLGKRIDNIEEILGSLEVMGGYALTKDPWIIRMILDRVDHESRKLWATKSAEFATPTLEQLRHFLRKRRITIEQLHSWSDKLSSQGNRNMPYKNQHSTVPKPRSLLSSHLKNCPLCNKSHRLYQCDKFKILSSEDRRKKASDLSVCFNCLHTGHSFKACQSNFKCSICNQNHHTLLHQNAPSVLLSNSLNFRKYTEIILATAKVLVESFCGDKFPCRILLDSGSQVSLISERFFKKLSLKHKKLNLEISGVCDSKAGVAKGSAKLTLYSTFNSLKSINIDALILPEITHNLPDKDIEFTDLALLKKYQLADPLFFKSDKIDILLGVDSYYEILLGSPVNIIDRYWIQNTVFGWVIAGKGILRQDSVKVHSVIVNELLDLDATLKRFWEVEEIPEKSTVTFNNSKSEEHFLSTYSRLKDGRYQVRLPFSTTPDRLGSSEAIAFKRLMLLEKKFQRNSEFRQKYVESMNLYISKGYMTPISCDERSNQKTCYLPHHGVLTVSNTESKLRIVFDASAKSSSNLSLNDVLCTGENLQLDLIQILLNFMIFPYVLVTDIEKMFLNISLHPEDRPFQRVLWRENIFQPVSHYEMTTVTFGEVCSPFLAMRVIRQLAKDERDNFPWAAEVLENSIYMDDIITGAYTITDLDLLKQQLNGIMSSAGFTLKKWASNAENVLKDIPISDRAIDNSINLKEENSIKTLGILWNSISDSFCFKIRINPEPTLTKRSLLSESARLYDPFGWLSPVIISIKQLYQSLWRLKLGWDDHLPDDIASKWIKIRSTLTSLESIKLPRWLKLNKSSKFELHGFSDASEKAFGAVVYIKHINEDGECFTRILISKTRVSPIKTITIPRLELCGALMLAELLSYLLKCFDHWTPNYCCWTDSKVVLAWINTNPSSLKTFVSNRIEKIQNLTQSTSWSYVPSSQNPADLASRGLSPEQLLNSDLWWHGPSWLQEANFSEFENQMVESSLIPDLKKVKVKSFLNISQIDVLDRYSKLDKMLRIIAYCFRFVRKCRREVTCPFLSPMEIQNSLESLCRVEQYKYFKETIDRLRDSRPLKSKDGLISLNPFLDQSSTLRVGGRLQNSNLNNATKHPIILPKESPLSRLIIEKEHVSGCHIGVNTTFANVRQQFWIPHLRNLVKKIIFSCVKCFRNRPKPTIQQMGILPYDRVNPARAFSKVGIDFAGPFLIRLKRCRGNNTVKVFVSVFVCFTTKAIHLEHVMDLSTDSCLAAINRFVSRRGRPQIIYSDNGTNFIGSKNLLNESFRVLKDENFNKYLAASLAVERIEWRCIPPRAPEFGGLWEAAVKSFKICLFKTIGCEKLTLEEFLTVLAQVECSLNTRPVCYIMDGTENIEIITPGHFLVSSHLKGIPELSNESCSLKSRWLHIQNLHRNFWNSWSKNYLISLNNRGKNHIAKQNIQTGQVGVLIENTKPHQWPLAIVENTIPGPDGLIRVIDLRLANNSILRRPVSKFCTLPINDLVSDL